MIKKIKNWLLIRLIHLFCRTFHWTYRYEWVNIKHFSDAKSQSPHQSCAIALWHNNCFAGSMSHAGQKITAMVSQSFDGECIAYLLNKLGMSSVRGSSSRGGRAALSALIKSMKSGWSAAITVDGPRGPYKRVKSGVISLASRTGSPIVPLVAIGDKQWVFHKSWDQFRLPRPFSRVVVVYGEPIEVASGLTDEDYERHKAEIYEALENLEAQARLYIRSET